MQENEYIIHREGGKLWAQLCESAESPDWDLPTVIGGAWATSPERAVEAWQTEL